MNTFSYNFLSILFTCAFIINADSPDYPWNHIKRISIETKTTHPMDPLKKKNSANLCDSDSSLSGNFKGTFETWVRDYDTCFWKNLFNNSKIDEIDYSTELAGAFACGFPEFEITIKITCTDNEKLFTAVKSIEPSMITLYSIKKKIKWQIYFNDKNKEKLKNRFIEIIDYGVNKVKSVNKSNCTDCP